MAKDGEDLIGSSSEDEESPLRKLLLLACPPHRNTGQRSILILSHVLELNQETIFKWIRNNRLPPLQAARVVDIAEGRVTLGDFSAYYLLENLDA